jgi:hypothetical protein
VTVHELKGFMSQNLHGALDEIDAISKGTKCIQPMVSLSINPPAKHNADLDMLTEAADKAEATLGISDQPRAIIIHEKEGRRHAHVVWSRIDADEMKAINLPHFKNKLARLSKDLYLQHGWDLPDGHKTNGWKNPLNFTLAEWQQAKRLGYDPREIKQIFQSAWERSDNLKSFAYGLSENGLFLCRGDRRGHVAVDVHGEVYSVSRWVGVKTKDVKLKLGKDLTTLPSVSNVQKDIKQRISKQIGGFLRDSHAQQKKDLVPLAAERLHMIHAHRREREDLKDKQRERHNVETKQRNARLRSGLAGVWDKLSGKASQIKKLNERDAYKSVQRDKRQRERLFIDQLKDRKALQRRMKAIRDQHVDERRELRRHVVKLMQRDELAPERMVQKRQDRHRDQGLDL